MSATKPEGDRAKPHAAEKLARKMAERDVTLSEPTKRGIRHLLRDIGPGIRMFFCALIAGALGSAGRIVADLIGWDTSDGNTLAAAIFFPAWIIAMWITWRLTGDDEFDPNP